MNLEIGEHSTFSIIDELICYIDLEIPKFTN